MTKPRQTPLGATKITDKHSDAVAFVRPATGLAAGQFVYSVFYASQSKPVECYRARTMAEVERAIANRFKARQATLAAKAKRSAERGFFVHTLKVGEILNTCWGYDQTNREFFEVVEVKGKSVVVREIGQLRDISGYDHGTCVPQPGRYIGEPIRKLVALGDLLRFESYRTASRWEGKPLYWSAYA